MSRFAPTSVLVASLLALSLPGASPALAAHGEVGCADVDVIVIRGSLEPSGSSLGLDGSTDINNPTGVYSLIKAELTAPTDGSTPVGQVVRTDIDYRAVAPNPLDGYLDFKRSVREGTTETVRYINEQAARCSSKRFVLLGYSQGALVAANAISPNNQRVFYQHEQIDPMLTAAYHARVAAIGLFADAGMNGPETFPWSPLPNRSVRGTTSLTWPAFKNGTRDDLNRGKNDGTFSPNAVGWSPRPLGTLETDHTGQVRNYCIWQDPICESPTAGGSEHLNYGGDIPAHRNLAIFAVEELRNRVDKTVPVTCSVTNASNPALVGTNALAATLRFKADVRDYTYASATISLNGLTTTLALDAANATTLRTTLLGNAFATSVALTGFNITAAGATPATKNLTSTGAASSNLGALTAGQPFAATVPGSGARSLTYIAGTQGATHDLSFGRYSVKATGYTSGGAVGAFVHLACDAVDTRQATFGRIAVW